MYVTHFLFPQVCKHNCINIYIYIYIYIYIISIGFDKWVIIEAELIDTITLIILTSPKKCNYKWNNKFLKKIIN